MDQEVFVPIFRAADERNVCFRHAKCMGEQADQPFIGGAVGGR